MPMPRDTRKVPQVQGQTDMGWGTPDEDAPHPDTVYVCRSCLSTQVVGPFRRTVDERWVHATCLDCGERVIANVKHRPTPSPSTEDETRGT